MCLLQVSHNEMKNRIAASDWGEHIDGGNPTQYFSDGRSPIPEYL